MSARAGNERRGLWLLWLYGLYLALPIYWLLRLSLQPNQAILSGGAGFTLGNFAEIFTNPVWYEGFLNSLSYVVINTVISVSVALPAAYAFSRYRFVGDRHLFFWLLSNRMAPPAVFLLPFFQLYSAVGLFDTPLAVALAHCLFTVPLAVWILEGFMSAVPRSLDEMARIDGHSLPYFFLRLFLPVIRSGIGVTVFFCFMFSWVELLLARTLTGSEAKPIVVVMTRTVSASGIDWGVLAAAGVLTILPGVAVVWFVRRHLVKGFALGRVS
ncbi:MAG: carbohydrate ABC transporter permease [Pseudomonadales bacterium]